MHEPYEARRFEREEKKDSAHYGWRSFVRALNENRTRGLPFRRRTLYPLSYKGVASFSRLGLTPDLLYVRYNKHRIECRGKINSTCCRQAPPPGFEPGPKVPKTRVLPLHQGGMRANASDTYARLRSAMPIQPVLLTGFQALSRGLSLQIG